MKKAQMQDHWQQYADHLKKARRAIQSNDIHRALEAAELSWPHIDGMLRHASNLDGRTERPLDGFKLVLKYAPPVLDYQILSRLEEFVSGKRRIRSSSTRDLAEDLKYSRGVLRNCHKVLRVFERVPTVSFTRIHREFDSNDFPTAQIFSIWQSMGLITSELREDESHFRLVTKLAALIWGKCPNCGAAARCPRLAIYESSNCPNCNHKVEFVFLQEFP